MKQVMKVFDYLEEIVMVIIMSVMVVVNFLNVVFRYLLPQSPFSFTEELTVLLFVWVTMFGIACGYKRHSHTGLTLFTDMLPKPVQRIFILIAMAASLAMILALFYLGLEMVQNQIRSGQILTALKAPRYIADSALPVGAVFIIIRVLHTGISDFIKFGKNSDDGIDLAKEGAE